MNSDVVLTNKKWTSSPELLLHLTFFIAASIVIILSFTMTVVGTSLVYLPWSIFPLPESCTARMLLGINCPGCGMTRAFISISHGEFSNAWRFNPASFVVYLFVLIQLPWQGYQMSRLLRGMPCVESTWIYILPIAMAVLMIVQWSVRLFL